ncbi:glycosyltransferase family 2 protein [Turicibacter sp. GALT-G1]|uniref:glycosyltransferase family 2 protein n=1 Tax=Turicibacter sp. GALT-G1 TaxID=2951140 RepID=UPI0021D4A364|nr:glycosyltransferase family 2 protein [Turicibacter sp. GALT-G1]MCU7207416.1 glycosyltransferase [Turicibacter sp. GALT-G1]
MNLNIILGEVLKRIKLNQLVYNNKLICKLLKLLIKKNSIDSVDDARNFLSHMSSKPLGKSFAKNVIQDIEYDLTIIIPAYNVEKYIEDCVNSIITQETKYKFLVKIINDGSIDQTRSILKQYEKFDNIQIIDQFNMGLSGARNTALKKIQSKYITFVDSDDKLEKNAIQLLLDAAFKNDSDIVEGGFYKFTNNNKIIEKQTHQSHDSINPFGNLRGYPWGKVIKSSLFENIKFPEGFWYEDTIFMYLIYPICKKTTTISEIVYWYRYNPQGITVTAKKNPKGIDTYWITEQLIEDMDELEIEKTQFIYEFTLFQIYFNFRRTKYMGPEAQKSLFCLSSNLIKTKFPQFKTTNRNQIELENALLNDDYKQYYLYCCFN